MAGNTGFTRKIQISMGIIALTGIMAIKAKPNVPQAIGDRFPAMTYFALAFDKWGVSRFPD